MKRPTIDTTAHYKKVRPSEVRVGDAVTFDEPVPGVRYFRITDTKTGPTTVLGYFVGTKKGEDTGRPSKVIGFAGERAYLIERPETPQERAAQSAPRGSTTGRVEEKVATRKVESAPASPSKDESSCPDLQPGDVAVTKVLRGGRVNLTVVRPGKPILQARDDHHNYKRIVEALDSGKTDNLDDLFNIPKSIEIQFKRLSDRVTLKRGIVYLDGDPQDNALTKLFIRFVNEDRLDDLGPLVAFYENVQQNPSTNSRDQLFSFLDKNDMTITKDGLIVAYKGVKKSGSGDKVEYKSCHAGPAIVDGKDVNGYVPNQPGSIIEMARSQVKDNPGQHCATGLHVGAWQYAAVERPMGGNATLECHIHPRDVVSVPNDHNAQKIRCCRYRVIGEVSKPVDGALKL